MNRQCLPNIRPSPTLTPSPDSSSLLQRRNLSISTTPTPSPVQPLLLQSRLILPHPQQRCDFVYASRKNQLLIRKARFRGKDLTRLCQDSLAEYVSLKSKLTEQTPRPPPLATLKRAWGMTYRGNITPKFSVKLFNQEGTSRAQSPRRRQHRSKTENDNGNGDNSREDEECMIGKKYSQMSLKEMLDGGEGFHLHLEIKERRANTIARTAKKRSRRESQDYQIDGW